jgi:hypothetical protein
MAMADHDPLDDDPPLEDHPRLAHLRAFLIEHYQAAHSPTARVDGANLCRAFAGHLHQHAAPELQASNQRTYDDLRALGFAVGAGTGNRTQVYGLEPKIHAAPLLAQLAAILPPVDDPAAPPPVQRAQAILTDTVAVSRQLVEEAVGIVVDIMRNSLDEGRRLQAATEIVSRGIPKLKAKEVGPATIDVEPGVTRPTVAEVQHLITTRLAKEPGDATATALQEQAFASARESLGEPPS